MEHPTGYVLPQLRSSKPAVNVDGFFRVVGDAITDNMNKHSIALTNRPLYSEEWPKERIATSGLPFDFIGFHVVRTQRASESNDKYVPSNGLRLVEQQPSPNAGYVCEDYFWKEEAVVQFTIFSQSNRRANDLVTWFTSLILSYQQKKYFMASGVYFLVFQGRLEDTIEKTQDQDLYTRRVQFRLRTQNIFNLEAKTLETFNFTVGLTGQAPSAAFTVQAPE